jgi:predicted transcriptional regulator
MPTITIRISREESARVARLAAKRGTGRSEVVRQAIARLDADEPRTLLDDWRDVAGTASGGPKDLAMNPRHLKGFGR